MNVLIFDKALCHLSSLMWITEPLFNSFIQTKNISFISASCTTGTRSLLFTSSFCVNTTRLVFPFWSFPFTEPSGQQAVPDTTPHTYRIWFTRAAERISFTWRKNSVFHDRLDCWTHWGRKDNFVKTNPLILWSTNFFYVTLSFSSYLTVILCISCSRIGPRIVPRLFSVTPQLHICHQLWKR